MLTFSGIERIAVGHDLDVCVKVTKVHASETKKIIAEQRRAGLYGASAKTAHEVSNQGTCSTGRCVGAALPISSRTAVSAPADDVQSPRAALHLREEDVAVRSAAAYRTSYSAFFKLEKSLQEIGARFNNLQRHRCVADEQWSASRGVLCQIDFGSCPVHAAPKPSVRQATAARGDENRGAEVLPRQRLVLSAVERLLARTSVEERTRQRQRDHPLRSPRDIAAETFAAGEPVVLLPRPPTSRPSALRGEARLPLHLLLQPSGGPPSAREAYSVVLGRRKRVTSATLAPG